MLAPTIKTHHQYAQLGYEVESGDEVPARQSRLRQYWKHGRIHLFYAILLILVASASRHSSSSQTQPRYYGDEPVKSELQLSTVRKTFELDLKYAMPPSPEVDEAWASLLPKEGGFFKHPKLAPQKSCVAVFHQLHCLDMIRQTLYEARPDFAARSRNDTGARGSRTAAAAAAGHHRTEHDHNHAHDMYHVGHCFDLVRQSILCKPDLTIEVGDPAIGGVTGFGTEHQCVDWRQLMDWMRDHE
ncbi:uncharacterized protein LY79DRAFT_672332 [Colletotrichum navitas]|uniref:Oxidase ustYa n=1 Tax=Colletotrichum navitas TaxID=681940 RepID=A0AAD8PS93_9PEZI|nr:uncharacterized protein LY79DRAFT_672332 [Colletotrichum navitas]KAK1579686.1 hypothetical protein LY79DRAFT_672332 [Colletotrichum navitas]